MSKAPHHFVKRSVSLDGHRTSVALEQLFWDEIEALARDEGSSVSRMISTIDRERNADQGLASALRLYVLKALQQASQR